MQAWLEARPIGEVSRYVDRFGAGLYALIFVVTAATLAAVIALHVTALILLVVPLAFVVALVIRNPTAGLYGLLIASLTIPAAPLPFPDSITDNIPFFINLSDPGSLNVPGVGITPAEILMLVIAIGLVGNLALSRQAEPVGKLLVPYLLFAVAVAIGEINGLAHGGDFKLSLWELRPQAYGFVVFIFASQLIKDRKQLKTLTAILVVSEVFKGGVGVVRYFITLNRQLGAFEAIQAHEESYLMGLFVTAVIIGLIWFRKPLIVLLIAVTPIVFTAIVVNHRRAGIGALGIEVVTVVVLAYILEPRLRRSLVVAGVLATVAGLIFVGVFWNQQYGAIAELIRPVKSLVVPTARDLSSDLYRQAESANLGATFRTSPLIGVGFGHPYLIIYPQNGVAAIDPLWNIIPHNSLLWVPMRMGAMGVIAFWGLISMAIVEAMWAARSLRDPWIRALLVFAVAAILGELFTGSVDVGLENYRNLIVLGLLLAMISRARWIASPAEDGLADERETERSGAPRRVLVRR